MLLHATAVAIEGRAVLITGPSGAGKSDLALRLIDRGAVLVSDDQVALTVDEAGRVLASPPPTIAGQFEVRGIGIIAMPHVSAMPVALLITIAEQMDRMPEPGTQTLCGQEIPVAAIDPFEGSAPIKVERALSEWGLSW